MSRTEGEIEVSLTKNQALVYALMIRAQAVTTEVKALEVHNAIHPNSQYTEATFDGKAAELRKIADQIIEILAKREV
jgi:hypothetical protein